MAGSNVIHRSVEVVAEAPAQLRSDRLLAMAHAGEKHGKRGCLCASYPLGRIVRDLGRASGFLKDRLNSSLPALFV